MSITNIIIYLIILLISVIIHEISHGYVSYLLGDDTAKLQNRLSLNPLKHIDPFLSVILPMIMIISGGPIFGGAKPVAVNKRKLKWGDYGMALVAIAGPISNLILAFVAFGVGVIFVNNQTVVDISVAFVQLNLGFLLFNMIPLPPLDGSRVIYAFAPEFIQNVFDKLERTAGVFLIFGFIILASPILHNYINSGYSFFIKLFSLIYNF